MDPLNQTGKLFQSAGEAVEDLVSVALSDALQDTVVQVSFQDVLPDLVQGGLDRADLDEDTSSHEAEDMIQAWMLSAG